MRPGCSLLYATPWSVYTRGGKVSEVTVEVEEPQVEATPTVIVVDAPTEESVPLWAIALTERVVNLENGLALTAAATAEAHATAEQAEQSADAAIDTAFTAIDIAVEAETTAEEVADIATATAVETGVIDEVIEDIGETELFEPDAMPTRTHPLFRSLEEWRGTIGG